ncbi:Putative tartrate transporter [Thiorhodovibrio winogradskyi]|uniref:Tartrate transporter n=1 Tax=Thiorhodovibrio winogradskyi TaxID=77007 RepID=A0ABZ0SHZ5_9GAMM|nr:MFS transporter [Thiorhodovibrio winogradskyi]
MPIETTEQACIRRITWHLIPFLGLLYIIAYLDRINVSFAALHMNQDLNLGAAAYGTGAGIFFLGYVLFEIPSNLLLRRIGPRIWIARIMITWGLISMAMALVRDEWTFYALRFLLGVAEAGFFPGIILYLTFWFPQQQRARIVALFATATALAGLIGSPISGALLGMHGIWGWSGWHWLFILEGLPAVILGVVVLAVLPDHPAQARWLPPPERDWLTEQLKREEQTLAQQPFARHRLGEALGSARVWLLGLIYFCMVIGMYGLTMWLPQMLRALTDADDLGIGLLNAIPFLAATAGMVLIGWLSDRHAERRWHLTGAFLLGALGCVLAALSPKLPLALAALSLATIGIWGVMGPFWALSTSFLSGVAAAAGIALINSIGNLGGFFGPSLMGWLKQWTHGYSAGLIAVATILLAGAILTASLGRLAAQAR